MRILNVPYDVSCVVPVSLCACVPVWLCASLVHVDDMSHAVVCWCSSRPWCVCPQLAGVSPYMKTILDAEGGYDQRMREKGLNPLCQLTSTL